MSATQGLAQEIGAKQLCHAVTASTGGIGDEADLQDYKAGQVVFLFLIEETGGSSGVNVDVKIYHGGQSSTDSLLKEVSFDEVSKSTKETFLVTIEGGYDRYAQIEDIVDTGGTSKVSAVVLGGKRES